MKDRGCDLACLLLISFEFPYLHSSLFLTGLASEGRGRTGAVGGIVSGTGEKHRCVDVCPRECRGPHSQGGPARRRTCGGSPGPGGGRGAISLLDELLIRGCVAAGGLRGGAQ
jgi:hypothetical protein